MILNSRKVTHICKSCLAVIFCIATLSVFADNDIRLKNQTDIFVVSGTEVPDSILEAVTYCTEQWSLFVTSEIPIHVSVSWQELKSNVNAYAKPTNYYAIDGVYYPCALAEKIQKKNLNGDDADIEVVINKTMPWHVSVDTELQEKQYDLITTLIHELAHGLGYIGNITTETLESKEFPSPTIFDMFVCDETMTPIVTKSNSSYVIDIEPITTNSLYWGGRIAKAYCGEYLKLYAPETFNSGSTVYHLDEATYTSGSGLELMTPVLRSTEIFRTPNTLTVAMLADIGWSDYFIAHEVPQNSTDLSSATQITYTVRDTLFDQGLQSVIYSFDNGTHTITLDASYDAETGILQATIPASPFDHTIVYTIRSITTNNDTIYAPTSYTSQWYTVFVGDDVEDPRIEHTPITSLNTTVTDINIKAELTDNFEIDSAYVSYEFTPCNSKESVSGTVNFDLVTGIASIAVSSFGCEIEECSLFSYTIVAVDKAGNTSSFDNGDAQEVAFSKLMEPVRFYISTFDEDGAADDFILDKCEIAKKEGFATVAIHTQHPYASSGTDGKYNQYTAVLKSPIIIASNPATMSFDEVVLVEPGKAGIEYGTFGFWDYVIVEASKSIESETWYPLGKVGWDSQLSSAWKTRYYSSTKNDGDNENSLAVGDSTLFRTHTINMLENKYFRVGDTVYVRFRLQADATNYAWGWAIDNLKIQERIALASPLVSSDVCVIYPSPCSDIVTISLDSEKLSYAELNSSTGLKVAYTETNTLDVSKCAPGLYVLKIVTQSGLVHVQKLLIQR